MNSRILRVRLAGELDRERGENALLREELRLKDARMRRLDPRKRPHYTPTERMAILELKAARAWNLADTSRAFMVDEETISNWMDRCADKDDGLLQISQPVNRYPDYVRYIVQRLKVLCPTMGKVRIAQTLARAGLHLGATTVGRILQEDPLPAKPDLMIVEEVRSKHAVTAKYANHVWHVDLTTILTSGFWAPWWPFCLAQIWPFCWWIVVMDVYLWLDDAPLFFETRGDDAAPIRLVLRLLDNRRHLPIVELEEAA